MSETPIPGAEQPTRTARHPLSIGHLVMGVAFAGLTVVWALVAGEALGEGAAVPVGRPVVVPEVQVRAADGFHRAAGGVRVVRLASGVQGGPVAGQRLGGAAGAGDASGAGMVGWV